MKYIGYYPINEGKGIKRNSSPAGKSKMDYIISLINRNNQRAEIISACDSVYGFAHGRKETLENGNTIQIFTSLGKRNKISILIDFIVMRSQLLCAFMNIKRGETVVCYHSLGYAKMLYLLHRVKKFNLVLEVEEIYQDVVPCGAWKAYWERKIISGADGYILAAEELSSEIPSGRPYIVINGTYRVESERHECFNDKKIHCVYAGTFDPTKGGAAAAAAAEFLPENYHVHILGFGTDEQIGQLKDLISTIQKKTKCTLTYDGLKSGEEYIQFLQKCQIGLCTQIPDAKYAKTSFPSKVLVYLANGLRVLCVRIPVVENSQVGNILTYYNHQSPIEIADAIQKINIAEHYDSRQLLSELDEQCNVDFKDLLEKVKYEVN